MKDTKKTEKIRIRKIFRIAICVTLMLFVVISTIGVASAAGNVLEGEGTLTGAFFVHGLDRIYLSSEYTSYSQRSPFISESETSEDVEFTVSISSASLSAYSTDYEGSVSLFGRWTPSDFPFLSAVDSCEVFYTYNGQTSTTSIDSVSSLPSGAVITELRSAGYGGNSFELDPSYVTPETTPKTGGIFSVFSLVISWIVSFVGTVIGMFYANGSLTFLGYLAVAALAFSVCFLLFAIIRNFIMFRG